MPLAYNVKGDHLRSPSFCITACCQTRSDYYFHQVKAIVPVVELARRSIPVEVEESAVPNPVGIVEAAMAAGIARVEAIEPEPAGPNPAALA